MCKIKITINLIGEVEVQGETTLRLNNLNANEFAEIKITATNTHINKTAEKVIQVTNKTYLEIKEKLKREMEEQIRKEKLLKEQEKEKIEVKETEVNKSSDLESKNDYTWLWFTSMVVVLFGVVITFHNHIGVILAIWLLIIIVVSVVNVMKIK